MAKHKEKEKKDFFISARKKIGPGLTSAPVWIVQKKGERVWNTKQKRQWKNVGLGKLYKKQKDK